MTDAPSRPDPLAPDYRSAGHGCRARPPRRARTRRSTATRPSTSSTGRPCRRRRRRRRAAVAGATGQPDPSRPLQAARRHPRRPGPPPPAGRRHSKQPRTARRKATLTFAAVFGALVGLPMMLAAEIAWCQQQLRLRESTRSSRSESRWPSPPRRSRRARCPPSRPRSRRCAWRCRGPIASPTCGSTASRQRRAREHGAALRGDDPVDSDDAYLPCRRATTATAARSHAVHHLRG